MLFCSDWTNEVQRQFLSDSQQLGCHTNATIWLALDKSWLHEKQVMNLIFWLTKQLHCRTVLFASYQELADPRTEDENLEKFDGKAAALQASPQFKSPGMHGAFIVQMTVVQLMDHRWHA